MRETLIHTVECIHLLNDPQYITIALIMSFNPPLRDSLPRAALPGPLARRGPPPKTTPPNWPKTGPRVGPEMTPEMSPKKVPLFLVQKGGHFGDQTGPLFGTRTGPPGRPAPGQKHCKRPCERPARPPRGDPLWDPFWDPKRRQNRARNRLNLGRLFFAKNEHLVSAKVHSN